MSPDAADTYDVVVVGAGPAGASAASSAARAGLRVALLDKAAFPRHKTCGGGLIGASLRSVPDVAGAPLREHIHAVSFSVAGGSTRVRTSDGPLLSMVVRSEFDQWLADVAVKDGVEFFDRRAVRSIEERGGTVFLETTGGRLEARVVVGADGTSGRISRYVGVELDRVDLGLELEVRADGTGSRWRGLVHLDWGPIPGSYAWVFPKDDLLAVGVIAAKGRPQDTKRYLREFVSQVGLERQEVVVDSGHVTRTRKSGSPLGRGRVLVVGDAAGLLEPWTREGISFAIRSGIAAGRAAASCLAEGGDGAGDVVGTYSAALSKELLPEMAAGEACLRAFERHPRAFHRLIASTPVGWNQFGRLTRGDTTLARAFTHRTVRSAIAGLSRV